MQVLPNIPYRMIEKFYELITTYLWKESKPKISTEILKLDKNHGGLRLVDLFNRQISLKAQWVIIIRNSVFWSEVAYRHIDIRLRDRIWLCNLSVENIEQICDGNDFWSQVLYAWCLYNYEEQVDDDLINCEILWYNSHIKIANEVFCWYNCWDAGLVYLYQLFDDTGQILKYDVIKARYGNVLSWYQHTQLLNAIPIKWKSYLMSNYSKEHAFTNYELIMEDSKISNKVYSRLNARKTLPSKQQIKWEKTTNSNLCAQEYFKLFSFPLKVTIATKFRDFQYRLLHSAIITNRMLYLWKMLPSDKCTFCKNEVERIPHLFCECDYVKSFWHTIKEFIQNNAVDEATLCVWSAENILSNVVYPKPSHVINLIVLVAKQFIYRQRCQKKTPYAEVFLRELEQIYNIEFRIAYNTGKMRRHYKKWCVIKQELTEKLDNFDEDNFINHYLQTM